MLPNWAQRLPWDVITDQARRLGLDPHLIAAVIQKESSGVQWRTRWEREWSHLWKPEAFAASLGVTVETEVIHQKMSWGLMQIMGGTAREMGFRGHLPELCASPALGIHWGGRYLARMMLRFRDPEKAIAAYNAGPGSLADGVIDNRKYVDAVLGFLGSLHGFPV